MQFTAHKSRKRAKVVSEDEENYNAAASVAEPEIEAVSNEDLEKVGDENDDNPALNDVRCLVSSPTI